MADPIALLDWVKRMIDETPRDFGHQENLVPCMWCGGLKPLHLPGCCVAPLDYRRKWETLRGQPWPSEIKNRRWR